ncbi:MAG: Rrf2 family transcriptional regulator [Pseudomonadota bacterium]
MQLSKGVEWAVHAAAILAAVPEGRGLSADALARYHGVPSAYMAKQMQALRRAGIIKSLRGASGGYALAKSPDEISLLDLTLAVESNGPIFRCTNIRCNGPCGLKSEEALDACPIAAAFAGAEATYRAALDAVPLSQIIAEVVMTQTPDHLLKVAAWIDNESGTPRG